MASVSELTAMLHSANLHAAEYVAGAKQGQEQLDQCIGVIQHAASETMRALGESQVAVLADAATKMNQAEAKIRAALELVQEGIEAALIATDLNAEYISRIN